MPHMYHISIYYSHGIDANKETTIILFNKNRKYIKRKKDIKESY